MSSLNVRTVKPTVVNHGGSRVPQTSVENQLTRMTMAHMLWEKQFYMDGKDSAAVLADLVQKADPAFVAKLALEARTAFKLRHVPLFLARGLAKKGALKATDLAEVIQRPDEMAEFLSLYWKDGKSPISNQVKKGLALAFGKFKEYQLAKWDKNSSAISLRDVMFLAHPKPANEAQAALFKRVAEQKLETPDTWETELSAGADKAATFTRLMAEGKLGALAFLRNLRNMEQAGVPSATIRAYGAQVNVDHVLPFRFIAAARIVPAYEDMLEAMMLRAVAGVEKLPGKTVLLIDVSGSMFGTKVSAKSDLDRIDAALALAILCREICEEVEIYTFCDRVVRVPPRRGFALIDAVHAAQTIPRGYTAEYCRTRGYGGTNLMAATRSINANVLYDRFIVLTDEESTDGAPAKPRNKGYMLNVASYKNGVNSGDWLTVTGFSEAVIDYIKMYEKYQ